MAPKLETQTLESLSDLSVTFSLGEHPCEDYPRTVLVMGCISIRGYAADSEEGELVPRPPGQ